MKNLRLNISYNNTMLKNIFQSGYYVNVATLSSDYFTQNLGQAVHFQRVPS